MMSKNLIKLDLFAKLFDTTRQTIARWKKEENKPAVNFTEKYLSNDMIKEFITTGKVLCFEDTDSNRETLYIVISNLKRVVEFYEKLNQKNKLLLQRFLKSEHYKNVNIKDLKFDSILVNHTNIYPNFFNALSKFLIHEDIHNSYELNKLLYSIAADELYFSFILMCLDLADENTFNKIKNDIYSYGIFDSFKNAYQWNLKDK